jgi:hypothetical protein
MKRLHLLLPLLFLATLVAVVPAQEPEATKTEAAKTEASKPADARETQKQFFENLKKLCGQEFEGATAFPDDPEHDFAGKALLMKVESCTENEVRIPFNVGEDTSRTWILTWSEKGLLLKHDHRKPDGTPDEVTMYGGWANAEGSALHQSFPADEETAKLIPDATTNKWTLRMAEGERHFAYELERHEKPRYKAVFQLKPVEK